MLRRTFLTGSLTTVALGALHPAAARAEVTAVDDDFLNLLTEANRKQIPIVLGNYQNASDSVRTVARKARRLVSGYVWGRSSYHHDASLLGPLTWLIEQLAVRQHEDGLYDVGNLHSPPDSAFAIQDVCMLYALLDADGQASTAGLRTTLASVIKKAGPALAAGGVHTPNHRWEVSAALARANHLFPDRRYVARIEDWLDEGIDATPDGIYGERSSTYAAEVTNPCLLTIAWLRAKPALLEYVRRNLDVTLYLLEPNGEVDTTASRRQDQKGGREVWWYLTQFRELALHTGDGRFTTVAKSIEARGTGELGDFLAEVLERPELSANLPAATPAPADFIQHYPSQASVRIRRDDRTATIFGGTDFHDIPVISSGLSTNPTFFKLRTGSAILDSVRLSPQFFSTGHFRSDGLRRTAPNTFKLQQEVKVPYHLPLPKRYRRADGRYALTPEGRFYASMDFPHRPKQYRTLRTEVTIVELTNGFDLTFDFTGDETAYAIELCFRPGGTLTGVDPLDAPGNYQLASGTGTYKVGADQITFGPGNGPTRVPMDPGERYTYLGGNLTPDGLRVYLTGRTPGHQLLQLRTT
ncbi:hypothetical protein GCM10009630_38190 [Kribbella jejuensis]|uniref:Heparinase II/III-like protein n=1 Tax=Kribbella jejuensis TaxID=236068 RepID=A0A542ES97_9ACTN|nr:hypothetical protein [Kribbella jejuensis]TQJ18227.1 hypothetical protein FB475_2362 [Kribbella jejuensis]